MITFRKPYIASLEIWTIALRQMDCWIVVNFGLVDHYNVKYQMDDCLADSCATSSTAFLFFYKTSDKLQLNDTHVCLTVRQLHDFEMKS